MVLRRTGVYGEPGRGGASRGASAPGGTIAGADVGAAAAPDSAEGAAPPAPFIVSALSSAICSELKFVIRRDPRP